MENKKAICFAYFCDGKFIGWYSDTFGTVTENRPKIYRYSSEMLETIKNNLNYSLSVYNLAILRYLFSIDS